MDKEMVEGEPFTWVGAFVYSHEKDENVFVGALRFPGEDPILDRRIASFVEVYGRAIPVEAISWITPNSLAPLNLSGEEWRLLGFKRIAQSPFLFRDQLRVNPYQEDKRGERSVLGPDEASYICDSCGEEIVVPLDLSAGSHQKYVEDCPICCHPNVIHVEIDDDGEAEVWTEPEQDYE